LKLKNKVRTVKKFRIRSPALHAKFLAFLKTISWDEILQSKDVALAFSLFYEKINKLFDDFYPVKSITTSDREPSFVTLEIKWYLRLKNKLMRQGKTDAASCIANKIKNKIAARNAAAFSKPCSGSRELWDRVHRITGGARRDASCGAQFSADQLNNHYAGVSTDLHYETPKHKSTASKYIEIVSEQQVFKMLDSGRSTAAGMDALPFWFLRLAAPCISAPLAYLYNMSLCFSYVPPQWKVGLITPVPKIPSPMSCSDFRPITVTPILSRLLERVVVKCFLYPVFINENSKHLFLDQFAYRPTGSTTAAITALLHHISELLLTNPYVHVIALDFSKAFDTVRHSTLMEKFANFPVPDYVYNWLVNFLTSRCHHTKFNDIISLIAFINASIVQGSGIGPGTFSVNASDLHPINLINLFLKYADDVDLVVPASHSQTVVAELDSISSWASTNNLKLNVSKSCELIVKRPRLSPVDPCIPPPVPGLPRVTSLKTLGVTFSDKLDFSEHFRNAVAKASKSMYALKILRAHGLCGQRLWRVCEATSVTHLTYAAPAWWGYADSGAKHQLQSVLAKLKRYGFLPPDFPSHQQLCDKMDKQLFLQILDNHTHVLHQLLPPRKDTQHSLRPRAHNRIIPPADAKFKRNLIIRMLYLNSY
jgi:hypothetical protein